MDRNVSIHLCFKGNKSGLFVNYFQIFFLARNVFVCFKLLRNQNRTFVISKNYIKTKQKRYKLRQGFPKTKQNVKIIKKKFWKRNKTKAFGQKILRTERKRFVSIQNFDLKTFTFDLFWNKSSKTEASDLERSLIWHCYMIDGPCRLPWRTTPLAPIWGWCLSNRIDLLLAVLSAVNVLSSYFVLTS